LHCGARSPDFELHIDHIIPRSIAEKDGFLDSPYGYVIDHEVNYQSVCDGCNIGKSKTFGRLSQAAGPGLSFCGGAINIPGIGFRASARHPGTKGQYPWRNGYQKAQPQIQKIMRSRTFNVVKQGAKP
jgi:hypothetical protein